MKASDLVKRLEADPDYLEMRRLKELELKEREAILAEDERGLLKELSDVGYELESVWDFVNNNNRYGFLRKFEGCYSSAYPILVRHLEVEHNPRIKEGIIRALTEKDANEVASEALLSAFYKEKDSNLKWVLANALRTVLTRSQKKKHPEYKEIYNAKGQP